VRLETFPPGYDMFVPDAPPADGAPQAYGSFANRRGSTDSPSSLRRGSPRGPSPDGDYNFCGASADERGCNSLSFKRFSRSVKLASQLYGSHPAPETIAEVEVKAEAKPPPEAPRAWHDSRNDYVGLTALIKESALLLSLLFLSSALAITSVNLHWGATPVFTLCFFALIPLAILLGDLTESLSGWCGPTLGGLVNATLGNATGACLPALRSPRCAL
jgi:hypothetical protein